MSVKQPDQEGQDGSPRLIEPRPNIPTNLHVVADSMPSDQDKPVFSESMLGELPIPLSETTGEPQTQSQPNGFGEPRASCQLEDDHNSGQRTAQHEIGAEGDSGLRPQSQATSETCNLFSNNIADSSPQRTIELQSNNPFKARLERRYNNAILDSNSHDGRSHPPQSPKVDRSMSPPSLARNAADAIFVDHADIIASGHEATMKPGTENKGHSEIQNVNAASGSNDPLIPTDNTRPTPPLLSPNLIELDETEEREAPHSSASYQPPSDKQRAPSLLEPPKSAHVAEEQPTLQDTPSETQGPQPPAQPSDIYGIRTVNWTDGVHKTLRRSPVLVQNENGPCPLLALVNSLVMRTPPDIQSPLIKALRSRERISLGLLIQTLFDELTTYVNEEHQLPDIEDLSNFLTMLHTGMNVNPRLTPNVNPDQPGMFHQTRDIKLYSAFSLPLVHGWLASPASEAHKAMLRTAEYHDDIQLLHFRKEELEERVLSGGTLTAEEEQLIKDIDHIQHFVNVENATQLSPFGLGHLNRSLAPGTICILFRNDHFSTLFKHPHSQQLFTLVTDAGYAGHAEVVWESLVDVNGSGSELFSGDFRPVGAAPSSPAQRRKDQSMEHSQNQKMNPGQHNEQTDADYAYALALQFQDEEEQRAQRARAERNSSRPESQSSWQPVSRRQHARRTSTNTPQDHRHVTGHRQPRQTQIIRPLVPPAPETPIRQTVSADDPNAPPPTYEQAARTPPYNPQDHSASQYDGQNGIAGPRSSSYHYGSGRTPYMNHPSARRRVPMPTSASTLGERPRERERSKDCVVM
uniref:DUF455 domain-containing protein n=1 Tax=Coccidioides posadasii RMSCC 3488 TaxID=454284 RepID=A0A0J6I7I4_COCPO|nr:DUF455 domain-containing protein [Coccidioides posadasii RMSCC 3488]